MIRAVLFDFGGVILTSPFDAFNCYEAEVGLPLDTIRGINSTNPDTNAWARFERGELNTAAFIVAFGAEASLLGFDIDGKRVVDALRGTLRPEMVEALRRCSQRLKTAMLTNNFRPPSNESSAAAMTDADAAELAEVFGLFDEIIESSVVGIRKPEPRFYEIACERLEVDPDECVFLDDLGINLKPARAMGMATIKVTEPRRALDELSVLVGFPLA